MTEDEDEDKDDDEDEAEVVVLQKNFGPPGVQN